MENETERFYAIDENKGFAEVSYDHLRGKMRGWIEKVVLILKHPGYYEELLKRFIANATEKGGEHHDLILWFNW